MSIMAPGEPSHSSVDPHDPPRPLVEVFAELGHTLLAAARSALADGSETEAGQRLAAAVDAFREAAREEPEIGALRVHLGSALSAAGKRLEAVTEYIEAVLLDPSRADVALPAATELLDRDVIERLAKPLRKLGKQKWIAGLDADATATHRFLARVAAAAGDDEAAETHWRTIVERDSADLVAVEQLSIALCGLGRSDEAVALVKAAVTRATTDEQTGRLRLALGEALAAAGRGVEAEHVLVEATRTDGAHRAPALLALANTLRERGTAAEAFARSLQAEAAMPDGSAGRIRAVVLQAQLLLDMGRAEEADEASARALSAAPTDLDAIAARVRTLVATGRDADQAQRLARGYLRVRPREVAGHRMLVDALKAGQRPGAEIAAAMANLADLAPASDQAALRLELARAHLDADELDQAEAALAAAATVDPTGAPGRERLRGELTRRRDRRAAEALGPDDDPGVRVHAWAAVVAASPGDATARLRHAEALRAQSAPAAAWAAAAEALAAADTDDVAASALELQAKLAYAEGRPDEERAELLYEASRRRYWQGGQWQEARTLMERAAGLRDGHAPTHWYLAEYALILSYVPDAEGRLGQVDGPTVARGLKHWAIAERLQPEPGEEWGWVFLILVGLLNQQARLPAVAPARHGWRAVLTLERYHLLGTDDLRCSVQLAQQLRYMDRRTSALRTLDGLSDTDPTVALERAAVATELGRDELARAWLPADPDDGDAWIARWPIRAALLARAKEYAKALPLVRRLAEEYPTLPGFRFPLAEVLERTGQREEALKEFAQTWTMRTDPSVLDDARVVGLAAYRLAVLSSPPDHALLTEAAALLERIQPLLSEPTYDRPTSLTDIALCAAALGDTEKAMRLVEQARPLYLFDRDLVDLLDDVDDLRRASSPWPTAARVAETLDRMAAAAKGRRAELDDPTPQNELAAALAQPVEEPWLRFGAAATSARLAEAEGHSEDAAQIYGRLLAEGAAYCPEATRPLRRYAHAHRDEGDDAFRVGDVSAAGRSWRRALDGLTSPGVAVDGDLADVHARLVLVSASEDAEVTREHLLAAGDAGHVGEIAAGLITDMRRYWALYDTLSRGFPDQRIAERLAEIRAATRPAVERLLEEDRHPEEEQFLPVVTPVVLEIGPGLVAEDTGLDVWTLFTDYIPAMRRGIQAELGVQVPGVRVRASELPSLGYAVRIDEDLVIGGTIAEGARWTPATAAGLAVAGVTAQERSTRPRGSWIAEADATAARAAGLAVEEDPLEFVIHCVDAVLRRNLHEIVGLQEIASLLAEWRKDVLVEGLLQQLVPDDEDYVRLSGVLRGLLAERVPLVDPVAVLEAAREAGWWSVPRHEVVSAVRRRLRDQLPGNRSGRLRLPLSDAWEVELAAAVWDGPDGLALSLPPERVHALLLDLGVYQADGERLVTVVTRSARVRPPLRVLLDREIEDVEVLTADEVIDAADTGGAP